jgi:5'-deoxynucleotidase YfbR-like HD superfamily hydrolase
MSPALARVKAIREGGRVARFHTLPMPERQSVAAHSWGVATLILALHPNPSINLIKAALWHDVAEGATGDVPASAKRRWPKINEAMLDAEADVEVLVGLAVALTAEEATWLRCCDLLELALTSLDQLRLGNRHFAAVLEGCGQWLCEQPRTSSPCLEVLAAIIETVEQERLLPLPR